MRFGANALVRPAPAGRGVMAGPAKRAAASVSACRRDNIVAAHIQFADGGGHGRCRECMGRTCGLTEPQQKNYRINLNREPKLLSNLDRPITFMGQKNRATR